MTQSVPAASIIGMIFTLCVCVGAPVALLIIFRKKLKADIWVFFLGCAIFYLFALVLERFLHNFVRTNWPSIQNNIWLFAAYGGIAAGVFEEVGRWLAMKFAMKKCLTKENSLMYGAGHGGVEAFLIVGAAAVSNLLAVIAVNNGAAATAGLTDDIVTQLCTYPSAMFYMSGIERLSAMTLHIALSYVVYRSVKDKKPLYLLLAIAIHLVVDAGTIIISTFLSVYLLELVVVLEVAVLLLFVIRAYKNERPAAQPDSEAPAY